MEATDSGHSFEQQFGKKEVLNFTEGRATVADVSPAFLKDEIPIVISPGWSENPDTYTETSKIAFGEGRRVLSFGYSKWDAKVRKGEYQESEYPEAELKKAQLILDVLEKKGIGKVDVIAHSEGAMNTLVAAMLKPDQFRNIVLDKPAGLIGKDTGVAITGRFVKLMLQEAIARPFLLSDPNSSMVAAARVARYIAENPKRTLDEMDALTRFDITELMSKLKDHGIMFSVIAGVDDPLFPVKRQISHLRASGGASALEGYYSVIGGHNELSLHAEKHAALAVNALEGLQYKRMSLDP